jgi:hypothetical protein
MALLFDAFFDRGGEASEPQPQAALRKRKVSASAAAGADGKGTAGADRKGTGHKARAGNRKGKKQAEPESCTWFDMAELSRTPAAAVLDKPPLAPIRLGSDFTGYGTDSLACHYLGLNYRVAFVAERSADKDVLRKALEDHVTCKTPEVKYADVRKRSSKDAPACDVFIAGPPCVTFSSLGKGKGTAASQGRLMYHSLRYIVDKLPRVAVIENVRGLTFRRHAGLLQHVKDCLHAVGYTVHVRILCTSESAVPQSRGRCYIVGIRSPKAPFKWPKKLPLVKLEHFLDTGNVKTGHPLNRR